MRCGLESTIACWCDSNARKDCVISFTLKEPSESGSCEFENSTLQGEHYGIPLYIANEAFIVLDLVPCNVVTHEKNDKKEEEEDQDRPSKVLKLDKSSRSKNKRNALKTDPPMIIEEFKNRFNKFTINRRQSLIRQVKFENLRGKCFLGLAPTELVFMRASVIE